MTNAVYRREVASLKDPQYVVLGKLSVCIPKSEFIEHDGIMEQITYEVSLWKGCRSLAETPWKYVLESCRR